MNQLNQITQQNASASEELAATAEEMSSQAENLLQLMAFFNIGQQRKSTTRQPTKSTAPSHTGHAHPALKRSPITPIDEASFGRF